MQAAASHLMIEPFDPLAQPFFDMGGVVEVTFGGVRLFIDLAEGEAYIETAPEFSMRALLEVQRIALQELGHELMDGAEADEELADGGMRHWLSRTWWATGHDGDKPGEEMVA